MRLERRLEEALQAAHAAGRELLPDCVAYDVARSTGLLVPRSIELDNLADARTIDLGVFRSDRLVVKVRSPERAHKSDLGGVAVCRNDSTSLERALAEIGRAVAAPALIEGYSVFEWVDHDAAPGGELLLGVRWTDDFGPVAVLALGGLEVERLKQGGELAPLLVGNASRGPSEDLLPASHPLLDFLTLPYRGRPGRWTRRQLEDLLRNVLAFAKTWMAPERNLRITDFEVNPMVASDRGPVALDGLLRRARAGVEIAPPRPLDHLCRLLEPSSIAIAGVSRRLNIGRLILRNIVRQGFDRDRLWVVKPGHPQTEAIDGCACFGTFGDLPETVDLAVLAVGAERLPELAREIIDGGRARTMILIPGGVGEREGTENLAAAIGDRVRRARAEGSGPLVNGGNCLGVRSVPGRYDTLFIPEHKLPLDGAPAPLALLSQSGAFAIARASQLTALAPRYIVTLGNQVDLTLGDYLNYLERDPAVSIFACYVEGFRPLDGSFFLDAVRRLRRTGRAVLLYRAGRTEAGARAAASHTASVAGSYRVAVELARHAGALVAESIAELDDLTRIFCLLDGRRPRGRRLGAMSNAGFEAVAMGDHLADLEMAQLTMETEALLANIFRRHHVDAIVAPRNPLDVTPVLDDEAFAAAARALIDDPGVDVGVIGCVPLTAALQTLPASDRHDEDLVRPTSIARRLIDLWHATTRPWVAVIDSGALYDPLASALEHGGIPTFRSADRALAALATWTRFHL